VSKLQVGDPAPEFSLPADTGGEISLSSLRGKKVVLYFYPKDSTPGCTTQAGEYSSLADSFSRQGAVILGVSRDSLKSHARFKERQGIAFPLLSDPDHRVHEAYGAWGEKRSYGKTSVGAIRTTVVIDEQGRVVALEVGVKARGDAARTLEILSPRCDPPGPGA